MRTEDTLLVTPLGINKKALKYGALIKGDF